MRQSRNPNKLVDREKGIALVDQSPELVVAVGKAVAADMVMYIMLMLKGLKRKLAMLLCMK